MDFYIGQNTHKMNMKIVRNDKLEKKQGLKEKEDFDEGRS